MKGLDCGTGNYVAATADAVRLQRNAFLTVPQNPTTKKSLQRLGIPFVEINNRIHVVGRHAYEYAQIFGNSDLRRPMAAGLLNPKEQDALPVLRLIIKEILGEPAKPDELVVYCVPGKPIDNEHFVDYHEDVLKQLIESLGYKARALNEADALAYTGLTDDNLTGIAISMGAGMCLRGDTKIPLLNGESKTIKDLAENHADEKFWVYSCKADGQVVPGLAWNPHKVKTTNKLLRLWFDNDDYLDCTPDHKVMMRDGSFTEAQNLVEGASLMPLYLRGRKIDGRPGYVEVKNNRTNRFNSVHRLVYAQHTNTVLEKDDIIHHINFDPSDNTPENLQLTDRAEHQLIHDNFGKWMRDNLKGRTYEECFGEERANEIKLKQSLSHKKSGPNKGTFQKGQTPWNKGLKTEEYKKYYKNGFSNQTQEFYNHKVIRIEPLIVEEDVYDMTVDKYHNFAIESGIFVHNCNISIMYAGMSALNFSVARGGDFIDQNVSRDCAITVAKAQYIKEHMSAGIDQSTQVVIKSGTASLKEPAILTREEQAVKTYYGVLIRYLLANIAKQFTDTTDMPNFPNPVPIVVGGGTSMIPGFIDIFNEQFIQQEFPINISEVRHVDEPLTAVARGCFADALLEEEV